MRLSEVRGHRHSSPSQKSSSSGEEPGTIRNSSAYTRPIEALFEGQSVTLIATGDIVGMSPAVQIVDENGRLDWVSAEDVTVTQREFLPQSESQRNRLRQQSQSSAAFSQT